MIPKAKRYLFPYVEFKHTLPTYARWDLAGTRDGYNDPVHCVWTSKYVLSWHIICDGDDQTLCSFNSREAAMVALDKLLVDKGYVLLTQEEAAKYKVLR